MARCNYDSTEVFQNAFTLILSNKNGDGMVASEEAARELRTLAKT
jgi:hypothetical protein